MTKPESTDFGFGGFFKGKKVLVTGHTGFKGAWLAEWLDLMGAEVGGLSLYVPSKPSLFEINGLASRIKHYEADIRDHESVDRIFAEFRPEILFHLAAQPIVSESYRDPRTTFQTNAIGTLNILEAIRNSADLKAAVLITSDKCYENVEWEFGYREDDRLGGKDPYSASKACAEVVFSSYFRSFFEGKPNLSKIATCRAGNVIGGGDWAKDRIVPDCFRAWSTGDGVTLRRPESTRPWQHVLEPLSGYLLLAQRLYEGKSGLNGESFNFGPPAEVNFPVGDLVARLAAVWGKGNFEVIPSNMAEAGLLKLCCDKALHRLGWRPSLAYEDTISLTGNWYRDFYQKDSDPKQLTLHQIRQYISKANDTRQVWTNVKGHT